MLRLAQAGALVAVLLVAVPAAVSAPDAARPGSDAASKVSPDGRWILFDRYFASGSRYSPPFRSLWLVDAAGRAESELVPATDRYFAAGWTADNLIRITDPAGSRPSRPPAGRRKG